MAKQVIYLELSQGKQSNGFLAIEAYKYGTDEQFKTFSSAMKQAQKDFNKEAKHYLKMSFKSIDTRSALKITDADRTVYNQFEVNN